MIKIGRKWTLSEESRLKRVKSLEKAREAKARRRQERLKAEKEAERKAKKELERWGKVGILEKLRLRR